MSLYGINAYTSNYNSLYSGLYNRSKSYSTSTSDLLELAKKADMVRSPSYRKKMLEQLKNNFSDKSDSEVGSSSNEMKLSSNAKQLSADALSLSSGGFSSWTNKSDAVKNFVDKYNSEIESLADAETTADKGRQSTLINTTQKYRSALEDIGITVGEDNKLSIDSSKLLNASERNVRSLLSGSYSYGSKIGYDMGGVSDSALDLVKKFAESYNNTLDSLEKSDSVQALEKGVSMVNTTKAFSRTLAKVGISVGSDNRLTIDEDALKKAPEETLRSLFSGGYSYANKIADKASFIGRASALEAQLSNSYTYNNKGGLDFFSQMAASLFENMI